MCVSLVLISIFKDNKKSESYSDRNELPPQQIRGKITEIWNYGIALELSEKLDGNFKGIKCINVSLDKNVINDSAEKSDNSEKEKFLDDFEVGDLVVVSVPQDVKVDEDKTIYLTVFSNLKKGV